MGKPGRKIRERTVGSSPSYFLRCFGICRKIHSDKPNVETGQEKKKQKRRHWLLRSIRPRLKNDESKPAMVYETEKQKLNVEDEKQNMFRVIRNVTDEKNLAAIGYKTVEVETKEKHMNEQRGINPDPLSVLGEEQTTPRGRKMYSTKTEGSKTKLKSPRVRKGSRVGSFDPLIGILIIMVTLMIMLLWGRVCAIICTSTWCYFLPRLKEVAAAAKCKGSGKGKTEEEVDLNSVAYKKKVVLEGFLLRQRRVSL